jgi:hypothetical protein
MAELGQIVVESTPPSGRCTGNELLHSSHSSKQRLRSFEVEVALLREGQGFVATAPWS